MESCADGIEHRMVLHMGIVKAPVLPIKVVAIDGERIDGCEGQVLVSRQCGCNGRIPTGLDNEPMKTLIEIMIGLEVSLGNMTFIE